MSLLLVYLRPLFFLKFLRNRVIPTILIACSLTKCAHLTRVGTHLSELLS